MHRMDCSSIAYVITSAMGDRPSNLSHICTAAGKDLWRWRQLAESKKEIQRLEFRERQQSDHAENVVIIERIATGRKEYQGYYGGYRIALAVAMWGSSSRGRMWIS